MANSATVVAFTLSFRCCLKVYITMTDNTNFYITYKQLERLVCLLSVIILNNDCMMTLLLHLSIYFCPLWQALFLLLLKGVFVL